MKEFQRLEYLQLHEERGSDLRWMEGWLLAHRQALGNAKEGFFPVMQMKGYCCCVLLQLKKVWRGCAAKVPARHRALASGVMELIPLATAECSTQRRATKLLLGAATSVHSCHSLQMKEFQRLEYLQLHEERGSGLRWMGAWLLAHRKALGNAKERLSLSCR